MIILAGSACLTLLLLNLDFNFLEGNLYDFRVSYGFQSRANQDIVMIALDDKTTQELDEFAPLPMDYHARFLEALEQLKPQAIGYLVDMNHVKQVNPDLLDKEWGPRFVQIAERLISGGTVFLLGTPFDVTGEVSPPNPLDTLPHSVALVHRDGNVFSEDKVTRRALLTLYKKPAFHLDLAQRLGVLDPDQMPRGSFYLPEIDGSYFFFRYHGNTSVSFVDTEDPIYPFYSFIDVLEHRVPLDRIQGKTVLVSTVSQDDSSDFALTPYSKARFANPKLLVHANILDSILRQDGIDRVPRIVNGLVTFTVTAFVLWWITTSTPLYGVFATLGLALFFLLTSHALFQFRGLWIRESQPLVGMFVGYYLAVPYRLIREYKKRWDYQKKNELLTQVEELKTNFLSLVTHDLKTPVARIQGLAEVLLRRDSETQTHQNKETLQNLMKASEELNHFISSILELSKVESNRLQLKLESKDLNQLIERSIESFRPQAAARGIQIKSDLEPLFPVKIDASLILKVINNLIDNAIKYSFAGTEICVTSQEDKDCIIISVRDQGIGMTTEEQENLFTRFYRAKNDVTIAIPGTGLGLYLTKYFIEAHLGRVEVKSEKNKGSVFKISLPIDPDSSLISESSSLLRHLALTKRFPERKENNTHV